MIKKIILITSIFLSMLSPSVASTIDNFKDGCGDPKTLAGMLTEQGYVPFTILLSSIDKHTQVEVLINTKLNELVMIRYKVNQNDDPVSKACMVFYGTNVHFDNDGLAEVYNKYMPNK